jgi:hypothetical protein
MTLSILELASNSRGVTTGARKQVRCVLDGARAARDWPAHKSITTPVGRCKRAPTPAVPEEFVAIQHFELPAMASVTGHRLEAMLSRGAVDIVPGDFFVGQLPAGQDIVLMANVIYLFSPDRELVRRTRMAMEPGGRVSDDRWRWQRL